MSNHIRTFVVLTLAAVILVGNSASLLGHDRTRESATPQKPKRRLQLKNPEAVGLLLNLMARYVEGVPDNARTEYDNAVAKALGRDPKAKQTLRRMLDRLKKKPEVMRAVPTEFRQLTATPHLNARYKTVFSRVPKPQAVGVDLDEFKAKPYTPPPVVPNIQIYYRGLRCIVETNDGSASDEPYLITSVVDADRNVQTTKHPFGGVSYEDVDAGEKPTGPEVAIYNGKAQDLAIIAVMMEHDFGDPNYFRDEIDAIVRLTAAAVTAATGIPIPEELIALLTDLFNWFTGAEDDLIAQENRFFAKNQLLDFASRGLNTTEKLQNPGGGPELDVPAAHNYHFRTRHRGDGGSYRAYYRVKEQ